MSSLSTNKTITKNKDTDENILPEDYPTYDISFKIIIIGNSNVGKSSLTKRATKDIFEKTYTTTVGFEFFTFNYIYLDKIIKLQIWDTCGQEIYRSLVQSFYRSSSLAVIVFSIDNLESFKNVSLWVKEVKKFSSPEVKIFLVGTKSDLEEKREVFSNDIKDLLCDYDIKYYLETSALTGFNSKRLFIDICKVMSEENINKKEFAYNSIYSKSNKSVINKNIQRRVSTVVDKKKDSECSC